MYVQYGCGLSAPENWINFDVSPTLRIQKIPFIGLLFGPVLNVKFPENVKYGDIIKGLPVAENSVDGIYCSHTLEHLALNDLRTALQNTYKVLKADGVFRMVLPDLEFYAREYISNLALGDVNSSYQFLENSMLGIKARPRGLSGFATAVLGNSHHLWMWDYLSLAKELDAAGFKGIRRCDFGDSDDRMFEYVEEQGRFINCLAIECKR